METSDNSHIALRCWFAMETSLRLRKHHAAMRHKVYPVCAGPAHTSRYTVCRCKHYRVAPQSHISTSDERPPGSCWCSQYFPFGNEGAIPLFVLGSIVRSSERCSSCRLARKERKSCNFPGKSSRSAYCTLTNIFIIFSRRRCIICGSAIHERCRHLRIMAFHLRWKCHSQSIFWVGAEKLSQNAVWYASKSSVIDKGCLHISRFFFNGGKK